MGTAATQSAAVRRAISGSRSSPRAITRTSSTALLEGARSAWRAHGGADAALRVERVPGAFELPLAARALARTGAIDAVVALGCVIRGDTAHFDFVAGACAHGLQRVMLDTGVPVSFGVLTVDTRAQALERAAPDSLNKGGEALETALAMASCCGG